jgi:hypothetical protein
VVIHSLTADTHARRTQLLYQKAFGKNVMVGIIAVPNPDHNPGIGGAIATVFEK